jgi:hypothetical protein
MRGEIKKHGHYELIETTHGHQILNLDDREWYAIVEGQQGDIIVHSDADHEKKKTLDEGEFYLTDFQDDPQFSDMPHLFLEKESGYIDFVLPNGLPTKRDHQKKLVRSDKSISKDVVKGHVEGKGNVGSEKQYEGQPENLRSLSKKELSEKAREQDISGRSKMNKEELVQRLKDKEER